MDVSKITGAAKRFAGALLNNITGILFLSGLAFIVFAVFTRSTFWGMVTLGSSLVLVSLILASENASNRQ